MGPFLESGPVLVGPPVPQPPLTVTGRALIVETMADLVADHSADPAVVDCVVGVEGEERRLQDRSRENDFITQRMIVGVHGLRVHQPLVRVDLAAQLG